MRNRRGSPGSSSRGGAPVFDEYYERDALWPTESLRRREALQRVQAAAGDLELVDYYRETFAHKPSWQGF